MLDRNEQRLKKRKQQLASGPTQENAVYVNVERGIERHVDVNVKCAIALYLIGWSFIGSFFTIRITRTYTQHTISFMPP